jgi:SAM-dependent methyltransferase
MSRSPQESTSSRSSGSPSAGESAASQYWASNLDPQNLEREAEGATGPALEDEIRFAWTPDVAAAFAWMTAGQGEPGWVVDLGAGLGAVSFAFARRGAKVMCVDTSPQRLGELMRRAREAGCADRIVPIAAAAEALPFGDGTVRGLFSRSVLIHTDMPRAAAEIARVLAAGGRAALAEPQPGNPFAWLYRRTLAPSVWREITTYFSAREQAIFLDRIGPGRVRPFYVFGFLAFVFQYAWPKPGLFEAALKMLGMIDRALLAAIGPTRRLAWFGLIEAEKADTNANASMEKREKR